MEGILVNAVGYNFVGKVIVNRANESWIRQGRAALAGKRTDGKTGGADCHRQRTKGGTATQRCTPARSIVGGCTERTGWHFAIRSSRGIASTYDSAQGSRIRGVSLFSEWPG